MAQNMKRGRNQRRRSGTNVNRALDSNGPDVKIRGTALQIHDKYQALARDAASSGDRIRAESLLQHAEHYHRLLKSMQPPQQQNQNNNQQEANNQAEGADPADAPQPEVEKTAEKETAPEEVVETSPEETAPAEEEKPKRTRRRRPSRKAAAAAEEASEPTEEPAE